MRLFQFVLSHLAGGGPLLCRGSGCRSGRAWRMRGFPSPLQSPAADDLHFFYWIPVINCLPTTCCRHLLRLGGSTAKIKLKTSCINTQSTLQRQQSIFASTSNCCRRALLRFPFENRPTQRLLGYIPSISQQCRRHSLASTCPFTMPQPTVHCLLLLLLLLFPLHSCGSSSFHLTLQARLTPATNVCTSSAPSSTRAHARTAPSKKQLRNSCSSTRCRWRWTPGSPPTKRQRSAASCSKHSTPP